MIIKNFKSLATTKAKKDALQILEAGYAAAQPKNFLRNFVKKNEIRLGKKRLILSDYEKKVGKKYGVSRFLFPSRKTFLIDENGILIHIIDEVNLNTHPMDIIKIFEQAEVGVKS